MSLQVAIMAGGAGTRFWPFSTPERPKQFLDITGEGTMMQCTVRRLTAMVKPEDIWVLTNAKYTDLVIEQCPELDPKHVVGEPMLRDTSAAVALAAGLARDRDPDGELAVLPADHVIRNTQAFCSTLAKAHQLAMLGHHVTIGIPPTFPAESFGYLQKGEPLATPGAYRLDSFIEKPRREKAEAFCRAGNYAWNAGMFVWKLEVLFRELQTFLPSHAAMASALGDNSDPVAWSLKAHELFEPLKKVSIDVGLMEKVSNIVTVDAEFDWSDVGGWLALQDVLGVNDEGNTLRGQVHLDRSNNNIIMVEDGCQPLLVSGVENMVVIVARGGNLVCSRDQVENIKDKVKEITGS